MITGSPPSSALGWVFFAFCLQAQEGKPGVKSPLPCSNCPQVNSYTHFDHSSIPSMGIFLSHFPTVGFTLVSSPRFPTLYMSGAAPMSCLSLSPSPPLRGFVLSIGGQLCPGGLCTPVLLWKMDCKADHWDPPFLCPHPGQCNYSTSIKRQSLFTHPMNVAWPVTCFGQQYLMGMTLYQRQACMSLSDPALASSTQSSPDQINTT